MTEKESLDEQYHNQDARLYRAIMEYASAEAEGRGYFAKGWNACYVLFADRFGWTPAQVRSLTLEELSLMFDVFFPPKPSSIKSRS